MTRLLRIPKVQMTIALICIIVSANIYRPSMTAFLLPLLAIGLTTIVDILLLKLRKIEVFFPSAAFVTGSIIGLLHGPNLPIYTLFVVIILAIFSKHFLKVSNKHVFNPAAFGLFIGSLLFGVDVSWWGVSFQQLRVTNVFLSFSFLILLVPGYVSLIKMRRFRIIFSFLISYWAINYLFNRTITLLDPTVTFFSLVMLPEPMTSPSKPIQQVLFGIFVAVFTLVISSSILNSRFLILNSFPDPLIGALLVGNLLFFKWK
ncbi:RnfABCDGE type electron transport complex subunit D [Candidatus Roizmanbacteria bacterium]|nr:RnfABCDGE type electron transport complex subunit D [Candidatus Roizmanbacteria bacterium]